MSGGWSRYTRAAASGNGTGFGASVAAAFWIFVVIGAIIALAQTPRQYWYVWLWVAGGVGLYAAIGWWVDRKLS